MPATEDTLHDFDFAAEVQGREELVRRWMRNDVRREECLRERADLVRRMEAAGTTPATLAADAERVRAELAVLVENYRTLKQAAEADLDAAEALYAELG